MKNYCLIGFTVGSFPVYVKRGVDISTLPMARLIIFLNTNGVTLNFPREDNNNTALDIFLDFKDDNDRNLFLLSWSEYFATLPPFDLEDQSFHSMYSTTLSSGVWTSIYDEPDDESYEADKYL